MRARARTRTHTHTHTHTHIYKRYKFDRVTFMWYTLDNAGDTFNI